MPVSEWEQETEAALAAAATEDGNGDTKRVYVRRIFSQIAPRYDLLNHLLSFNVDKAWRRRAIATLEWQRAPDGAYVDLCAGTLDVAAELSRQPGFRGHIVGADFAEPMLRAGLGKARGRERCRRDGTVSSRATVDSWGCAARPQPHVSSAWAE